MPNKIENLLVYLNTEFCIPQDNEVQNTQFENISLSILDNEDHEKSTLSSILDLIPDC